MKYSAVYLVSDCGKVIVTFRDIPEATAQGNTVLMANEAAIAALLDSMTHYFNERRMIPMPSKPQRDERTVNLPLSVSTKILFLNAVTAQDIKRSELARKIGFSRQEVARLLDLRHATKIDHLAKAFAALGRELEIIVR